MADTSLMYWQEQLGKVNPRVLRLQYKITGAKAATPIVSNSASMITFDALASQAVIDGYLGTSSEFAVAAYDATSMGADAFGGLVDMKGQCRHVAMMVAKCYSGTGGETLVERCVQASSALTASTLATEVAVGSQGNIGFKVDFGNTPDLDALTSGTIEIEIHWISK
jgi:hypothetical protein